jgi:hypothetical protein
MKLTFLFMLVDFVFHIEVGDARARMVWLVGMHETGERRGGAATDQPVHNSIARYVSNRHRSRRKPSTSCQSVDSPWRGIAQHVVANWNARACMVRHGGATERPVDIYIYT